VFASALTVEICDRHAEHTDPAAPLCPHGIITLGVPGDAIQVSDSTGERVAELVLVDKRRLRLVLNTTEYREAARLLARA
jgi:hypothetical protein